MRLLNFYAADGRSRLGVVSGDCAFDLTAAGGGRPDFASVTAWLRGGARARADAEELVGRWQASGGADAVALGSVRQAPLVARDVRIFCVGLNYADHAAESNLEPPSAPIFFAKLPSVVIADGDPIPLPASAALVDYEAEFAFVLGAPASCVTEEQARGCIAGYTIMNDVTARDFQRKDQQWFRSKNCNGFGPMGPWLVTADDIPDPGNLDLELRLNGQVRQRSNTRQLVFPPAALVARLSQTLALEAGDVISTGTPGGIGARQNPPIFLQPGDAIEIELQGVGILRNPVGARGRA